MLLSLGLILTLALILGGLLKKLNIPSLLGMILTGVILGPYVLDWIDTDILAISADLRKIALIVILIRAGLSLDIEDLKRVGRPAILMCFIPATLEIGIITWLAPRLLGISLLEGAILGTVIAAVSPAVVVPRMIHLIDRGIGKKNSIPQLIMAGASVDDIYVIVLFASFMNMYGGESFHFQDLIKVPVSIITGILLGIGLGYALVVLFKRLHVRDTVKVMILFSLAFFLIALEGFLEDYIPLSGLLAIMAMGASILSFYQPLALRLKNKFGKIWVGAEIILFVLVGAAVDISYISQAGFYSILILLAGLILRIIGVLISLIRTPLNWKEKIFCSISYLPKATVQAAIGSIPLAEGVAAGNTILVMAVLAILITAPIGAVGIDKGYKKLLD